jgi:EAL domain-containing protein (putative c-di-GMP-specific phosphodiesterase class I)
MIHLSLLAEGPSMDTDGHRPLARPAGVAWQERTTGRVLGLTAGVSIPAGVLLVVALLGASWGIAYSLGGERIVPPHWFYVPIVFAAVRFGLRGAVLTALVSTALAGPLLPEETATGQAQGLHNWTSRGAFFLAIGVLLSVLLYERRPTRARHLDLLRGDRALRQAMRRGELEVHYQPVYEIRGDGQRLVGAEALLRWRHPTRGLLGPGPHIEIAERTGFIHELGEHTLRLVSAQVHEWRNYLEGALFVVGVNVSGVQLGDAHLTDRFRAHLEATGVNVDHLGIEITETAFLSSADNAQTQLEALRDLGFHIAVDDFGTGYSALSYVHRFPIESIKLDGSFTARITDDDQAASIVRTLIQLAHVLGYAALAEGVETQAQLDLLKGMGCDCAQGFLLARPIPAGQMSALLKQQQHELLARDSWVFG